MPLAPAPRNVGELFNCFSNPEGLGEATDSNGRNICISYKTRGANLRFKEEGSIVLVGSIFAASVLDW